MMRLFSSEGVGSSPLRLSWPAFVALAIGVGCGVLALAQTVALPQFTPRIWGAWVLALAFCVANYVVTARAHEAAGAGEKRGQAWRLWALFQWAAWAFALMFSILPPLCVMAGFQWLVPLDVVSDDNLKVAVFVGWVCIGILFLVGASTGSATPMLSTQGHSSRLAGLSVFPSA
jgi:hypothetical protein